MNFIQKIFLVSRTLRYLRSRQIFYRLYYAARARFRRLTGAVYPLLRPRPARVLHLEEPLTNPTSYRREDRPNNPEHSGGQIFAFLNIEHRFDAALDWNFLAYGRLWAYNLNYFDFLLQPGLTQADGLALIRDWIDRLTSQSIGLEAYPTSLRLVNWIKFVIQHQISDPTIESSLAAQADILADNLEYQIMGNHLLENALALLWAAYYFADRTYYQLAQRILRQELPEQILADGAHFELSPMYHQIILGRLLDCLNLVQNNPQFERELLGLLQETIGPMQNWLALMTFRRGDIPLFNDSSRGIGPESRQLQNYAARLGLPPAQPALAVRPESNYRRIDRGNYEIIVDLGNIGPDYIPGHAHADTFSFELAINNQPWLVDTGVSTYEVCPRRLYERSTAAHNTVQIAGREQSEVWASFRVGRRAKVIRREISPDQVTAWHDGYRTLGAVHKRTFRFLENGIEIIDEIESAQILPAVALLHFAPGIVLQKIDSRTIQAGPGQIWLEPGCVAEIASYEYAPEFNRRQSAELLKIPLNTHLRLKLLTSVDAAPSTPDA